MTHSTSCISPQTRYESQLYHTQYCSIILWARCAYILWTGFYSNEMFLNVRDWVEKRVCRYLFLYLLRKTYNFFSLPLIVLSLGTRGLWPRTQIYLANIKIMMLFSFYLSFLCPRTDHGEISLYTGNTEYKLNSLIISIFIKINLGPRTRPSGFWLCLARNLAAVARYLRVRSLGVRNFSSSYSKGLSTV